MSKASCSRSWQAEATLDERLSRGDRASFERHVATCESCAAELRRLRWLAELAQQVPVQPYPELEQRRRRNALLRRANALTLTPRRARRWPLLGAAALALAIVGVLFLRSPAPELAQGAGVPTYEIQASPGAHLSTKERGATVRLVTLQGKFNVTVRKLLPEQRFLLELPDGELEVQGTRFVVHTDGERTQRVSVFEGRVALRLRDHGHHLLGAGQSWTAPVRAGVPSNSLSAVPSDAPPADTPMSSSSASPAPASPRPSSAGDDFARAMSAFSGGHYDRAETLLQTFERAHPRDGRVEDALFLRAIARSRRGNSEGAAALGREYLSRYPKGLRRPEVERLLQ